jgi:hypothetical protein
MSVINQELFKQIRDNFEKALQEKNGWGKNDVMNLFNKVAAETTMSFVGGSEGDDEEEEETPPPKKRPPTAKPLKKKKIAEVQEEGEEDMAEEEENIHAVSSQPPKKSNKPHPLEGHDRRDLRHGITPPHLQKSGKKDPPWNS